jgi:hypothetical protein
MKPPKPMSKLISKVVDVICHGGCHLELLIKTRKFHMNEGQCKDFNNMFIKHNFFKNNKKSISK